MEAWSIEGNPHRYEGGSDPSADVDYGYKFTLVRVGVSRNVNVEAASGPRAQELTEVLAAQAVSEHLDQEEPPPRIVMSREGTFHASS